MKWTNEEKTVLLDTWANTPPEWTTEQDVLAIASRAVELAAVRDGGRVAAGLIQRYRNENETLRSELTEARATIARLTAAAQALSEHADKAGGPAPGSACTCHMLQRDTQWHDTDCPARPQETA